MSLTSDETYYTPIIGPWLAKIGQVANIMSVPCSPSPEIWVEAYFHSLPQLVWSLFKPDPLDEAFERGGQPHRSKRRNRMRGLARLTSHIPLAGGRYGAALFKLGSLAQRVGWYGLIIDAGVDLALNWTSTAYTWAGCLGSGAGPCQLTSEDIGVPHEDSIMLWSVVYDPSGWNTVDGMVIPPGEQVRIAFHAAVAPWATHPDLAGTAFLQLVNASTGKVLFATGAMDSTAPGGKNRNQSRTFYHAPRGTSTKYQVLYSVDGQGYVQFDGTTLSAVLASQSDGAFGADPP